ncbi:formate dehydrogenase accessory sulfurtransferase FdhD [Chloroflexota bacterium]
MTTNMEEAATESLVNGAASDISHYHFSSEKWLKESGPVPQEMALTIFVNGEELVTILCTPTKLNCLVIGFLYSEGIISDMRDIATMRVCEDDSLADIRLVNPEYKSPSRRTIGSGCGGGISFETDLVKVNSDLAVTPSEVLSLMKQLQEQAKLYRLCGGVHTSALCDTKNLLVVAEDIGRHNTLDKIVGECLLTGVSSKDRLLLTTGRISSEMLTKAISMETPIVISRSSPTERSISLAQELGIALVGYVRGNRLSAYSHQERLQAT